MSDKAIYRWEAAPSNDDPRICGLCLRGWGSRLVTPPPGYFEVQNTKTGIFHAKKRGPTTRCGKPIYFEVQG